MAVPPPPPGALPANPAKPHLRLTLKARRAGLVERLGEDGARAGAEAAAALILPHIPPSAVVGLYLALPQELDPAPLVEALHARGQALAMPHLYDLRTMRFRAWTPGDPIERGPMRLRQPLPEAPERAPDLIVTPLLGFDRKGGRIGHGAGHYDRAFAQFPGARRLGLAWSVQELCSVPRDPWDVAVHAVVTEREFIPVVAE
jgi:5-formyltetrahydrofolate cyclo-ligase